MEVKMQYTVGLEEVPKEIISLLPHCEDFKSRIGTSLVTLIEEHNFILAMDEIEDIRRSMYKIDQRLADCQAILKGYLNVKSRPPEKEEPQNDLDFDLEQLEQLKGMADMLQPSAEAGDDPAS
tara:strand:+ start:151 stop:519 length:369 start_codon:yes stop_codon:yes gene_type:complete